jgi:tetratricopeptide (TPR) repeat protein
LRVLASAALALGLLVARETSAGTNEVLRFLESRVESDPRDFLAWNRLVDVYLQCLRDTGDDTFLSRAARAAERSLAASPPSQNASGLAARARVELASHRFTAARDSARELATLMPGRSLPSQLLGDALLELGDYDEARRAYVTMVRIERISVSTEPRLARLDIIHGRNDLAREHLTRALALARELVPPAPETVAWCLVQLGELAFKSGDWNAAERHYSAALEAVPDHYVAREHLAELRGAQGRTGEAVALYEAVISKVPRPELQQALGDLYAFVGKTAEAEPWYERAAAAYLRSVAAGDVRYLHHLAGFYSDSEEDGAKAVEFAAKDLALRHSIYAYDAWAWALYKHGRVTEAAEAITRALATGVKDAHILFHAGMIRMGAGDVAGGTAALFGALGANPHSNAFHVHR